MSINNLPPTATDVTVQAVINSGAPGDATSGRATPTQSPYLTPTPTGLPAGDYIFGSTYTNMVVTNGGGNGMYQNAFSTSSDIQKWHLPGVYLPQITASYFGSTTYVYPSQSWNSYYYLYGNGKSNMAHTFFFSPKIEGTYTIADFNYGNGLWDSDSSYWSGYLYLGNSADQPQKRFLVHPYDSNHIPAGIYTVTQVSSTRAIGNINPSSDLTVYLYAPAPDPSHQWYISPIPGAPAGHYSFVNMRTGRTIDTYNNNQTGSQVGQATYSASESQDWLLFYNINGTAQIKSQASGLCLDGPGAVLVQYSCAYADSKSWILQLQQLGPATVQ